MYWNKATSKEGFLLARNISHLLKALSVNSMTWTWKYGKYCWSGAYAKEFKRLFVTSTDTLNKRIKVSCVPTVIAV